MKIAAVTNDGRSISAHFGRSRTYLVVTVENGAIVEREMRDKTACDHGHHEHGHDHAHDHDHDQDQNASGQAIALTMSAAAPPVDGHTHAASVIADCDVVLSRGMGRGMYNNLRRVGVRAVLTDIVLIDEAIQAYIAGQLEEHPELVH